MKSLSRLPPPPQQINDYLNGHIIGHYVMKKALSVAIYNHFSNISISRYKNKAKKTKRQKEKTQIDNFQIARVNVKVSRTSAMLHLSLSVSCCFKLNFLSIETKGCGGRRICNLQIKTIPGK
jgi:ATP-dependent protease Clp ATPase subunit